jgi:pimeloyl-ACP methyl ester carboxylesterase
MKWQQATLQANGLHIFFTRTGGDKPPVVLNHGATDNGLCWLPVAEQLAEDYDVLMPDARGHGRSSSGNGRYDSVSRAEDLVAFINALNLQKPVIMGHSMGAQTTLFTAALYPHAITAAILEDPLLHLAEEDVLSGMQGKDVGKMIQANAQQSKKTHTFVLRAFARKNFGWPRNELKHWAQSKKQLSDDFIQSLGAGKDEADAWEMLAKVSAPVLLITGNRDKGAIVSSAAAEKAQSIHTQLQVAHFDTGHNIRRENFEGYMHAVKAFLHQVTAA